VDLERALATLSDGERAAIAACYYAGLSHEEAALALGIPLGTVKTHVLRAKARNPGETMNDLDRLLREDARVMGALPAALAPGKVSLLDGFADVAGLRGITPAAVTAIGMAVALLVSALVLAADSD
jgi:hypothetical protein